MHQQRVIYPFPPLDQARKLFSEKTGFELD